MILLDTNILVEVLESGPKFPEIRQKIFGIGEGEALAVSAITYFEILNARDAHRMQKIPLFRITHIVPVDQAIAEKASNIFLNSFGSIRKHIPDAFIAATALVYNVPLWTFDSDFKRISDLILY